MNTYLALDRINNVQPLFKTQMEDNRAAGSPRQFENFSSYINKNKGSEFIV
jgi:hypothetical protein